MSYVKRLARRALAVLAVVAGLAHCGTPFGATEANEVSGISETIAYCQSVGRACRLDAGVDATAFGGCFGKYDACVRDAGLRDDASSISQGALR